MIVQERRFDLGEDAVFDVDLADDGFCLALVGRPNVRVAETEHEPLVYRRPEPGSLRVVWFGESRWELPLSVALGDIAFVRVVDDERVLLVADSPSKENPANAHVVDRSGEIEASFHAGWCIEDVLVSPEGIVITYFDEGVFSTNPLSQTGLNVFDFTGSRTLDADTARFVSEMGIADCYCAAWASEHRVVFCAYTSFKYASIDLRTGACRSWVTPGRIHGAQALSVVETHRGDVVFFAGSYAERDRIFRWRAGTSGFERVGEHTGQLRGLRGGRFLAPQRDGYTLIDLHG
jgi:hypothetical protein